MLAQYFQLRRKSAESTGLLSSDFIFATAFVRLASRLSPSGPLTKSCHLRRCWIALLVTGVFALLCAPALWDSASKGNANRKAVLAARRDMGRPLLKNTSD